MKKWWFMVHHICFLEHLSRHCKQSWRMGKWSTSPLVTSVNRPNTLINSRPYRLSSSSITTSVSVQQENERNGLHWLHLHRNSRPHQATAESNPESQYWLYIHREHRTKAVIDELQSDLKNLPLLEPQIQPTTHPDNELIMRQQSIRDAIRDIRKFEPGNDVNCFITNLNKTHTIQVKPELANYPRMKDEFVITDK